MGFFGASDSTALGSQHASQVCHRLHAHHLCALMQLLPNQHRCAADPFGNVPKYWECAGKSKCWEYLNGYVAGCFSADVQVGQLAGCGGEIGASQGGASGCGCALRRATAQPPRQVLVMNHDFQLASITPRAVQHCFAELWLDRCRMLALDASAV